MKATDEGRSNASDEHQASRKLAQTSKRTTDMSQASPNTLQNLAWQMEHGEISPAGAIKTAYDLGAAHLQEREAAYDDIFKWLLGESGDFPLSEPGKRYNWRTVLRRRLLAVGEGRDE